MVSRRRDELKKSHQKSRQSTKPFEFELNQECKAEIVGGAVLVFVLLAFLFLVTVFGKTATADQTFPNPYQFDDWSDKFISELTPKYKQNPVPGTKDEVKYIRLIMLYSYGRNGKKRGYKIHTRIFTDLNSCVHEMDNQIAKLKIPQIHEHDGLYCVSDKGIVKFYNYYYRYFHKGQTASNDVKIK